MLTLCLAFQQDGQLKPAIVAQQTQNTFSRFIRALATLHINNEKLCTNINKIHGQTTHWHQLQEANLWVNL